MQGQRGHNSGRTALVLAGGGVSGAVYEIGALRAIDTLLVNRTVNDFDIYVGTSAGALVCSFLANGLATTELMRVLNGSHPLASFPEARDLFRLNSGELLRRGLGLPRRLARAGLGLFSSRGRVFLLDVLASLGQIMPTGIYDSCGIGDWVQRNIALMGGTNYFDQLSKELYIIATRLEDGRRAVFSAETPDVTIAQAVAASSAVPAIYKPMRIADHEYIDGGFRGTASLDLAIEHGASLVVCINPLVPVDSRRSRVPGNHPSSPFLSDQGLEAIIAQTTRVFFHSGLKYHIKQLQRRHPDVDIILIEPRLDDTRMFFANIMRLQDRIAIAEHGFRSVSVDLAGGYELYKETLARYGIKISRGLVLADLEEIRRSGHDPAVIQRVLERRARHSSPDQPVGGQSLVAELERVLAMLEAQIENL